MLAFGYMLLVMLIVATISLAENSRTHEGLVPSSTHRRVPLGQEALDLIKDSWDFFYRTFCSIDNYPSYSTTTTTSISLVNPMPKVFCLFCFYNIQGTILLYYLSNYLSTYSWNHLFLKKQLVQSRVYSMWKFYSCLFAPPISRQIQFLKTQLMATLFSDAFIWKSNKPSRWLGGNGSLKLKT